MSRYMVYHYKTLQISLSEAKYFIKTARSQEANVFIPHCLTPLYVQFAAVCAELPAGSAKHLFASMQPPAAGVTYVFVCVVP